MSNPAYPPPPAYSDAAAYPPQAGGPATGQYPPTGYGFQPAQQQPPPPAPAQYGLNPVNNYSTEYAPKTNPDPMPTRAVSGASSTSSHDVDYINASSFSDKAIRRGFVRKVYLILTTQLLVTFGCVALFTFVDEIGFFVQRTPVFYYVSYGTFLVTYIVLICIPAVRRKSPGNFICLAVFTLAFTYMVATISSFYTTNSVLIAAGITAAVCLAISLFAIQTKIDFTMCSGLLFALVMVLFFFGISCIIVYATIGYSFILDCVWGGLAALVFSLFLIYDTQMIVGGKKHELDPEEYVYGALQLYIDVVYLFLIILACFGGKN